VPQTDIESVAQHARAATDTETSSENSAFGPREIALLQRVPDTCGNQLFSVIIA